jgi:hypothetical protein
MDSTFLVREPLEFRGRVELMSWMIASHKYTLLMPNETAYVPDMTSDANRMEVRKNWDKLMPR